MTTSENRPLSVPHLVMGLIFVGLFAIWALLSSGVADADSLHWLVPVPLVVAGVVGLVAATRANRPSELATGDAADPAQ